KIQLKYSRGGAVTEISVTLADRLQMCETAAQAGSAEAANRLAGMYFQGDGVTKDAVMGRSWLKRAAGLGSSPGQGAWGDVLWSGDGGTADPVEAVRWYRKAADAGEAGGMFMTGVSLALGKGNVKDPVQAMPWFRKAADKDFPAAYSSLGYAYETG